MNKEKFVELVTRYLSNKATLDEVEQLRILLEQNDYQELYNWILDKWTLSVEKDTPVFDLQSGLNKLTKKIRANEPSFNWKNKKVPLFRHHTNLLKVAASVVLFIVGTLFLLNHFTVSPKQLTLNEKSTLVGQKSILTLFDGTKITLNANSKLKYPTHFGETSRDVYLEGEAYFEVVHNSHKPFIVHTNEISTTVLGTKFNVCSFSDEDNIEVSLVEGKVTVSNTEDENSGEVLLKPKEQFIYNKKRHKTEVRKFNIVKVVGWRDNTFIFNNEPLGIALKKLERAFGVKFELSAKNKVKRYRLKANIKNESFWGVVETIKYATGLEYKVISENNEIEKVMFWE